MKPVESNTDGTEQFLVNYRDLTRSNLKGYPDFVIDMHSDLRGAARL